ncbi:hypothetical protein [Streptomyces macrosporus]|uniref:Uncharacterized protein n=1 Tax=Streptomyces macrosporus TaxID=44032 RepID=A0ABN3JF82_9ACTN
MSAASSLDALLTVQRARAAARAGDLERAAALLDGLDTPDAVAVPALDLRARVHAQRGESAEADACWARVLELSPGHAGALAGRRTLAEVRAGRRRPRPRTSVTWAAVAAVVAVSVPAAGAVYVAADTDDRAARPAADADRRRADALAERLAALETDRTRAADRRARALEAVADALTLPGVRVQRRARDVRLLFEDGLFPYGTHLDPAGAELLTRVGRVLADLDADVTIVGHSVVVPGGRPGGGSPMALARAQVGARHLAEAGGLPLTAFALRTADQRHGPHPDPSDNRTLTLLVAPRS